MKGIEINSQFQQVLDFVNRTGRLLFLTGKAGTGKTTLLRYIKENTLKQMAIVAPTGVAAINAGGSTIHSFFQFPFNPFLPVLNSEGSLDATRSKLPVLKYSSQRLAIFRNLELLVIDEVSMVRADLLDQIDLTLRQTRKKNHLPFGGVQVLLIGDMYQLPPVVAPEEWGMLQTVYRNAYFFESLVVRANRPVHIELEKIYRQNETVFIDLLNKVRNNQVDRQTLELLNSHYRPDLSKEEYGENITLTTHNKKADEINKRNLDELKGKVFTYKARPDGIFPEKNYPADETLSLKVGTKVMFLKNNVEKNYYNGKIGTVSSLDDDKIKVKCSEDESEIEVGRETWTNVSYALDKKSSQIDEQVLGTFSQFPLRLAWAITIHKSQGLTFEKVIIDAAEAFSAGQVYVALSRCRSLAGLTLSSQISGQSLFNDRDIVSFSSRKHSAAELDENFTSAQNEYTKSVLLSIFDMSETGALKKELAGSFTLYANRIPAAGKAWWTEFSNKVEQLEEVSRKFRNQLLQMLNNNVGINDLSVQERIKKAAAYFDPELKNLLGALQTSAVSIENKEAANDIGEQLQSIYDQLSLQQATVKICLNGFELTDYLQKRTALKLQPFRVSVYASASNTRVSAEAMYPDLYRLLLRKRDEICRDYQRDVFMVANAKTLVELCNYLPTSEEDLLRISGFGKAKAGEFGEEFLSIVRSFMKENTLTSLMHTKPGGKKKKEAESREKKKRGAVKGSTQSESFALIREGHTVAEVAGMRGLTKGTVETHLIPFIRNGELSVDQLIEPGKQKLIREALNKYKKEEGLNPIKGRLGDEVSFSEIRWMMASMEGPDSTQE